MRETWQNRTPGRAADVRDAQFGVPAAAINKLSLTDYYQVSRILELAGIWIGEKYLDWYWIH